jgi:NitT/TauT family transport system substrate-binding protein
MPPPWRDFGRKHKRWCIRRVERILESVNLGPHGHAEETLRFYALRLHEAGVIKSDPQKLLAQGTDWRFVEQLKKELKT